MSLPLYWAVLRRRRKFVAFGVLLAVLLSLLSYVRPAADPVPTLVYRQQETWESSASILLTQPGFPQGRSTFPNRGPFADPNRFVSLASIYASLATTDDVKAEIKKKGPVPGFFFALPAVDRVANNTPLPIITTFGHASSAAGAVETVRRGTDALIEYIRVRQSEAGIPDNQRVYLEVATSPSPAQVVVPRKKTLPIFVLLAVLSATLVLAFTLENLRLQQRAEASERPAVADLRIGPDPVEVELLRPESEYPPAKVAEAKHLHGEQEPAEVDVRGADDVVEPRLPEVRRWA
jgi:hypothetical protein